MRGISVELRELFSIAFWLSDLLLSTVNCQLSTVNCQPLGPGTASSSETSVQTNDNNSEY
jgi:hypothetical protein